MIEIKINNKPILVPEGSTVYEAAKKAAIDIPTMCHLPGYAHHTSCMICVVLEKNSGKLLPACSTPVMENMDISTQHEEVLNSRKTALELLLSDHIGDCDAPCTLVCPAHMDIPQMNRLIVQKKFKEAFQIIINNIALPSVLGRICPAPCEKACKRAQIDNAVSICLLKRIAGDENIENLYIPKSNSNNSKIRIGIIGAGPTGLSCALYLACYGYVVTLFEKNDKPGGMLQYAIDDETLPKDILHDEIERIKNAGVQFVLNSPINPEAFNKLHNEYDYIVIATGEKDENFGAKLGSSGIQVEKQDFSTSIPRVYAGGSVVKESKMAIRSMAHGKEIAESIHYSAQGKSKPKSQFQSKFGKLRPLEFHEYLKESVKTTRIEPKNGIKNGFTQDEAILEAKRCLNCDCKKKSNCKLRDYSSLYEANQKHFNLSERKHIRKHIQQNNVIFESGKCIKCGICTRITEKANEKYGFTFIGRGFQMEIGPPILSGQKNAIDETAQKCVESCPTGALSFLNEFK